MDFDKKNGQEAILTIYDKYNNYGMLNDIQFNWSHCKLNIRLICSCFQKDMP